ncbi:S1 family peptidase [Streptomyces millisiae]|uniref:S1 family peptidase n=1 Tax=Streptomyces millisiae TaxID=3075542 RepID=A0ABU2LWJ8_9ACTN|nr:S1 family peptidase [Streptomyces sp. DSM 44918]MDT0321953.1 S1 family peptidase [Streptomyces sp. DSM 44918]
MTHRRTSNRRLWAASAGIVALVAGTFAVAQANATPTAPDEAIPTVLSSVEAGQLASTLVGTLDDAVAGSYYDAEAGTLVVNVVDESARAAVEDSGAEARMVSYSLDELAEVRSQVSEFAVPGTAWTVDPVTNTVKVTVDGTVQGEARAAVEDSVAALGDAATFETVAGEFQPFVAGGDAIFSSGARCSLGFNVTTAAGTPGFLTAGHCGETGSTWSDEAGGATVGTMTESEFPGSDFALVEYEGEVDAPSEVNLYDGTAQEITGAAEAVVGQPVQRSGSTTGLHDGVVTAVDVSVSYPQGTVEGTIQTTVCAEPGDSGGALFADGEAVGLTSGGSGDCTSGGTTFFYPVTDALAAVGATLP